MKRCTQCNNEKLEKEFAHNRCNKSGLSFICKSCMAVNYAKKRSIEIYTPVKDLLELHSPEFVHNDKRQIIGIYIEKINVFISYDKGIYFINTNTESIHVKSLAKVFEWVQILTTKFINENKLMLC